MSEFALAALTPISATRWAWSSATCHCLVSVSLYDDSPPTSALYASVSVEFPATIPFTRAVSAAMAAL
jgi:hypothetical protein